MLLCCSAFASLDQKSPVATSYFHSCMCNGTLSFLVLYAGKSFECIHVFVCMYIPPATLSEKESHGVTNYLPKNLPKTPRFCVFLAACFS
mmetsp:Transcript_100525/g.162073  ORF Transcript_100525/g.162073 Transcript_100525/m.162073 type:complete len:90 (-) Transcript_100525:162-431(-)